jgi:DNA-binding HxlR family transcriptional regulator
MLIQTLRKLESYALVSRKSYPEVPPRVEYRLTPLGRSLARLASLFGRWVERNVVNLVRAEGNGVRPQLPESAPESRGRRIAVP